DPGAEPGGDLPALPADQPGLPAGAGPGRHGGDRCGGGGPDAARVRRHRRGADERDRGGGGADLRQCHADHGRAQRVCRGPRLSRAGVHRPLGRAQRLAADGDAGPGRPGAAAGGAGRAGDGRLPAGGWIRRAGVMAVLPAGGDQPVRAAKARTGRRAAVPGAALPRSAAAVLPHLRIPAVVEPGLYRRRRPGGRGGAGGRRRVADVSATIRCIPAGGFTMNAIRPLACLLVLLTLLSACADGAVATGDTAEPAFEPVAASDDVGTTLDPVSATTDPDSPFEADAPPPARTPDVIYVPTPEPVVDAMLEMANVGPGDVLYDLGSGDGRIPITAAKRFGIRAVGIDINPVRIMEANANAEEAGVTDKVTFIEGDMFDAWISD